MNSAQLTPAILRSNYTKSDGLQKCTLKF